LEIIVLDGSQKEGVRSRLRFLKLFRSSITADWLEGSETQRTLEAPTSSPTLLAKASILKIKTG
jgi:hypothetical protein